MKKKAVTFMLATILALSLGLVLAGPVWAANLLSNGDFETGDFTGWTVFQTSSWDNQGVTNHSVELFDTDGDSTPTESAKFSVGEMSLDFSAWHGGGIYQQVLAGAGAWTVSADIAVENTGLALNGEGGYFELIVDDVRVDQYQCDDIPGDTINQATLSANGTFTTAGNHEIRIQITRQSLPADALSQYIDNVELVLDTLDPLLDIKSTSCPNPLNLKSKGVLPVAILGTEDFDVTEIDPTSVLLEGVAPLRWAIEDVATPFDGEITEGCCECCTTEGPDGYDDLTLKFDKQAIVAALGDVGDGDCIVMTLTGSLYDGTLILGEDVGKIIKKGQNGNGPAATASSNGKSKGPKPK